MLPAERMQVDAMPVVSPRARLKELLRERDPSFWGELQRAVRATQEFDELLALGTLRRRAVQADVAEKPVQTALRVALVGGYTLVPLRDVVELALWAKGFDPTLFVGEYDNYVSEILEPTSPLYTFAPELVVLLPPSRRAVFGGSLTADRSEQQAQVQAHVDHLLGLARTCHERSRAEIILCNYPMSPQFDLGPYRRRSLGSDFSFRKAVNLELGLAAPSFVHPCDLEFLSARRGGLASRDARRWFESKQPGSPACLVDIATEVAHVARALRKGPKKVLVLDLDNTLWGGVIGDDGMDGIELGDTSARGEAFKAFQTYIASLAPRGTLLCVSSKNDHAKAVEPFEKHPEMVLRMDHIVSFKANWNPKSDNIRAMAEELNLGLDSFVFVDDNPAEIDIVRQFLPAVETILLGDDPSEYVAQLAGSRFFEPTQLTREDLERTKQYQVENERRAMLSSSTDMGAYLDSLEMRAQIRPFRGEDVPRITQLINKSNQFNVTTIRRTEAEIEAMLQPGAFAGFSIRLEDRFGDHGLIAVVITELRGETLAVDTWLMSCRVLMRGVEAETVNTIVALARQRGAREVSGRYVPTAKNDMVRDLYPRMGFQPVAPADVGGEPGTQPSTFVLDVATFEPRKTAIRLTEGLS